MGVLVAAIPFDLSTIEVRVDRFICDSPQFVRWRKNHRKSRINKKWHKRYGAIMKYCPGKCYKMRLPPMDCGFGLYDHGIDCFLMCPCFKAQFDKYLADEAKRNAQV